MADGPIFWHHGLFLQPQHFQLSDRNLAAAMGPLISSLRPYFWGAAAVEADLGALAAGRMEFSRLSLLFPDGQGPIATFPGNSVCAGRQISADAIPAGGGLTVYLGLKGIKVGEPNVTQAEIV